MVKVPATLLAGALLMSSVEAPRAEVREEVVCGRKVIAVYAEESPLEGTYRGEWSTLAPRVGRITLCAALILKGVGNGLINISYYWRGTASRGETHKVTEFDGKTFKITDVEFSIGGNCEMEARHASGLNTTLRKDGCQN
jgi:hypothetical protein